MNVNKGFTLLEMLMVLAVLGVLLAVSVMGMQNYLQQLRLNEATVTTQQTLKRVLDEAITQSREVRLSVSSSDLIWEMKPAAGSWQEAGRVTLPYEAQISIVSGGSVLINGRGLPLQQRQFQVTRSSESKMVTLLVSGLVVVQ